MKLTKRELREAIEMWENRKPVKPIKEELGGDYYYRCPWLTCSTVIRSDYDYCPKCGAKFIWEDDYVGKHI